MPVANCFLDNRVETRKYEEIIFRLSENLAINSTDITINFIKSEYQVGKAFRLMIFLYLPSIWQQNEVEKIGLEFTKTLSECLGIETCDIFLITSIIESGNVIANNTVERWQ